MATKRSLTPGKRRTAGDRLVARVVALRYRGRTIPSIAQTLRCSIADVRRCLFAARVRLQCESRYYLGHGITLACTRKPKHKGRHRGALPGANITW